MNSLYRLPVHEDLHGFFIAELYVAVLVGIIRIVNAYFYMFIFNGISRGQYLVIFAQAIGIPGTKENKRKGYRSSSIQSGKYMLQLFRTVGFPRFFTAPGMLQPVILSYISSRKTVKKPLYQVAEKRVGIIGFQCLYAWNRLCGQVQIECRKYHTAAESAFTFTPSGIGKKRYCIPVGRETGIREIPPVNAWTEAGFRHLTGC